jgi:hypothetical protein
MSKGSALISIARNCLELEVSNSFPITSGLPNSTGPFLYKRENKTFLRVNGQGISSIHIAPQAMNFR